MPTITRNLEKALEARLESIGFKKRRGLVFTKPLGNDAIAWVGLNHAASRGTVDVFPVVGVRHQLLEQTRCKLLQEKDDGVAPPTIAGNIGYLSSDRSRTYDFGPDDISQTLLDELANDIATRGLPWSEKHASLVSLVEALQTERFVVREQAAFRIPTALRLLGRHEEAAASVQVYLDTISQRTDAAAERFRSFARAFTVA